MYARPVSFPGHLSNQELIAALPLLVRRESQAIAELVAHLAEVDARRLYRDQAFPSMHQYCVDALHLCEGAAYKRITAARAARRFPIVLELLAGGRLHLSAICLLAPHLTEENHLSLLEAAAHRSKRDWRRSASSSSSPSPGRRGSGSRRRATSSPTRCRTAIWPRSWTGRSTRCCASCAARSTLRPRRRGRRGRPREASTRGTSHIT